MRQGPEFLGLDGRTAIIGADEVFLVLPVSEGGHAAFCRECGHEVRVENGLADAGRIPHAQGCQVGALVAMATAAGKPVLLRCAGLEVAS